jgi:ferredoxin--NADP+ reductase
MFEAGNRVISILGARNEDYLILEDSMSKISHELKICTDDGSKGRHGFVTDELKEILETEEIAEVVAIGPVPMMNAVSSLTRDYQVKTTVSLNPIMIDGTGMCGGCRVKIGDETKFACIDGPEFDGHLVDFKGLWRRLQAYRREEEKANRAYEEEEA